jgi:hypothetical protein
VTQRLRRSEAQVSVLSAAPGTLGDANPKAAGASVLLHGATRSTQQWRSLVPVEAAGDALGAHGHGGEDPMGPDAVAKFAEWHAMRKYATS